MRPIRMSLAIAAAPFFEKAILGIMERTGITNKIAAFTVMLLFHRGRPLPHNLCVWWVSVLRPFYAVYIR